MTFFKQAYSLDLRSLALFRIALGLIVLGDLVARRQGDDLRAFYTDAGVLPRTVLTHRFGWPEIWSLHLVDGSTGFQTFLFIVAAAFAVSQIAGYRTRIVTVISWVMIVSLQSRNPFILHGGDTFLRLLLFWAIFLPLGKCFSIDSMADFDDAGQRRAPLAPSLALAVQVAAVYFFAFLLKSGPEWKDGTALAYALNIEQMATPFGQFLLGHAAGWLPWLTLTVRYAELIIAILILLPWQLARTVAVWSMLLLQFGFAFSLRVGHFPFVAVAAALALLPTGVWEWVAQRRDSRRRSADHGTLPPVHPIVGCAMFVTLGAVLLVNFATVGWVRLPIAITHAVNLLRLDQEWNMFAPSPREPDGWYVITGKLANGTTANIWRPREPIDQAWQKPPAREMNAQYPSERWAVYMMDLHKPEMRDHVPLFANYLCRRTNEALAPESSKRVENLEIYFTERKDQLDRTATQPLERTLLWTQRCGS